MKLFATFFALAASSNSTGLPSWPGVASLDADEPNPCGTKKVFLESAVNKTCTFSFNGFKPWRVYVGGDYAVPDEDPTVYKITNFEGRGADAVDVTVFWEQRDGADGLPDNSTCGTYDDIDMDCDDNGVALEGFFLQETANDFRMSKTSNYNFQVAGTQEGDQITITLRDWLGHGWGAQNLTTSHGTILADEVNVVQDDWGNLYTDTGIVTVQVDSRVADNFELQTQQQPGNLWDPCAFLSEVTKDN